MSASLMRQPLVLALLFLPSGCLVGVLLIYPLVNGVWLGFTDASPLNRSLHFVGLANFIDLLTDPKFWEVAKAIGWPELAGRIRTGRTPAM